MSDNTIFTDILTFTKVDGIDDNKVFFDITTADGLVISKSALTGQTATISGDLTVTGDFTILGNTIVTNSTELAVSNKNLLMNVPVEPIQPGGTTTLLVDVVQTATVVNKGTGFLPNAIIAVIFDQSPLGPGPTFTAVGTVAADALGEVNVGTLVTISDNGSGYLVVPNFIFGGTTAAEGTTTIDGFGTLLSATITVPGVGFEPLTTMDIRIEVSPGVTAIGRVDTDATGNIVVGAIPLINITNLGSGYLTAPTFIVTNTLPRSIVSEDKAGIIVVRDWFDGTEPHVGIIWNDNEQAWDLNNAISQDVYTTNIGAGMPLASNPRIINVGTAIDPSDVVIKSTLDALTLEDLVDVNLIGAVNTNDILMYTRTSVGPDVFEWTNMPFDMSLVTGGVSSGFLFWDASLITPAFVYLDNIPWANLDSALSNVAKDGQGSLKYLTDVLLPLDLLTPPPLTLDIYKDVVLSWDYNAQIFRTINPITLLTNKLDRIQDVVYPNVYVETKTGIAKISSDQGNIIIDNNAVNGDIKLSTEVTGAVEIDAGDISLFTRNPILLRTVASGGSDDAVVNAGGDLKLASSASNKSVFIQGVKFPNNTETTAAVDGSVLVYSSLPVKSLSWQVPTPIVAPYDIHNVNSQTYVSTQSDVDKIVMIAPPLGYVSSVPGPGPVFNTVIDEVGIYMNPGSNRQVRIEGTGTTSIHSDEILEISANSDISITPGPTRKLTLNGYRFPLSTAAPLAGDFLVVDTDTSKLKFSTVLGLPPVGTGLLHNDGANSLTWEKVRVALTVNLSFSIGPGVFDDYSTINDALEYLTNTYYISHATSYTVPGYPFVTLNLQPTYVMEEQVFLDGVNAEWVTIAASTAIEVRPYLFTRTDVPGILGNMAPAFLATNGAKLPIIDCVFYGILPLVPPMTPLFSVGVMTDGIGSSASITPNGGIRDFYVNVHAHDMSMINADAADLSNPTALVPTEYGVLASNSAKISVIMSDISKCNYGVDARNNSSIDCSSADVTLSVTTGVAARNGSSVNAGLTLSTDFMVVYGSNINANGATGTFSQTVNTITSNGIIYG